MAVCIAAITADNHIVTVSDTMLLGLTSGGDKVTSKLRAFAGDWGALMAANDFAQCEPVVQKTADYFKNRVNNSIRSESATADPTRQKLLRTFPGAAWLEVD